MSSLHSVGNMKTRRIHCACPSIQNYVMNSIKCCNGVCTNSYNANLIYFWTDRCYTAPIIQEAQKNFINVLKASLLNKNRT